MVYYLHRDHLKSVRIITDSGGKDVRRTVFAPFGKRERVAGVHHETKGYIGEHHDDESGYLFLNARYMDPEVGRFTSPDWWNPTKAGVGTELR